jgi:predicted RND superfamily exporter protein/signal transduction histidine kinase
LERLTRLSLEFPKTTLAVLFVVTVILAAGLPKVRPEFGYRVLIGDDHPAVQRLDGFIEKFGGGLPIQIGWECGPGLPCKNVFDAESMAVSSAISEKLRSMPGVGRVVTPSNAPLLVAGEDGFSVRRFVENGSRVPDATELADLAVSDSLWTGSVISKDGLAAVITVQPVDSTNDTSTAVSQAVFDAIRPFEDQGFTFYLDGDPIVNLIIGRDLAESTARLIPFTVLVIGLILLLFCRSLSFTAVALATMGVALAWTFGMLGWLGWPQDGILEVLAPLILVVGVCDSVHLLSCYSSTREKAGVSTRSARLSAAAKVVGPPALLTSLTTAAAFASFASSDLATFVRFGSIATFGVLACFFMTFSLLPVLVTLVPEKPARETAVSENWEAALAGLLGASERRKTLVLVMASVGIAVCLMGVEYLRVDQDWTESLGESSYVVRSRQFLEERLGRSYTLELEIRLPPGTELEDPETLRKLSGFVSFLESIDELDGATSVLDVVARVNRLLHGNRSDFNRVSDTTIGNAEILELIGFDDPGLLGAWVSFDRKAVRISVGSSELTTSSQRSILDAVERHAAANLPTSWEVLSTGRLAMQFAWVNDVQATQMRSFPTALVLVFAMIAIFFKSVRLAVAAMVPTLMPIVVTLGAMGWAGLTLDVGRSMIAVILLGIGVDDSIHILDHYRRQRLSGADSASAIRSSVHHTGRAVITTSFALSLGFLTLMASAWQSIASFGFFVAIAILGALVASLVVLPALIFAFAPSDEGSNGRGQSERKGRSTLTTSVFVLLPLVAVALAALMMAVRDDRPMRSPCWTLPSGHVMTLPGSACPLQLLDQIRWVASSTGERQPLRDASRILSTSRSPVAVEVLRRGREVSIDLELVENTPLLRATSIGAAMLVATILMVLPLLLLLHSKSRAALPLSVFYCASGVIAIAALSGQPSVFLNIAAIFALAIAPAAVVQIGMVFPTESNVVRAAPSLYYVPYVMSAGLGLIALIALDRTPVLWPTFVYLILLLWGMAWLVLLASCAFVVRESPSPSGRSRAGFVVVSSLLLPAIVSVSLGWGSGPAEITATYLWTSALWIPIPIGFAISRFDLFDVGWHVRTGSARVVYFIASAFFVSGLIYLGARVAGFSGNEVDFGLLLLMACGSVIAAESIRRPLRGFLQAALSPRIEELRVLRDRCSGEMANLRSEHEISRLALSVLTDGIHVRSGWISLRHGDVWEPAETVGSMRPPSQATTLAADRLVAVTQVAYLETDEVSKDRSTLLADGVSVVARVTHGDEPLGLILLDPDGSRPVLSGFELDFVASIASQAAIAIHNSRLADERAAVERDAATVRVSLDLMHDVGKDLGWMRGLAKRLAERTTADVKTRRQAAQVAEIAEAVIGRMKAFVHDATKKRDDPPGITRVDELIERSLRGLIARYGPDRVRVSHDPTLRRIRCHENVGRTLFNLVDNAIQASDADDPVRVSATMNTGGWLVVSVVDSGSGIPPGLISQVMEPGFTTRRSQGGLGVGLSLSRDMIEALGGKLELAPASDGGVHAQIQVPIPESWRSGQ